MADRTGLALSQLPRSASARVEAVYGIAGGASYQFDPQQIFLAGGGQSLIDANAVTTGIAADALLTANNANAKADISIPFASRFIAEGSPVLPWVSKISVQVGNITTGARVLEYVPDSAPATQPNAIVTGDGRRWVPADGITPFHFGAVGDGVADDTDALNRFLAFTRRVMSLNPKEFNLSGGSYRITAPIRFTRPTGNYYRHTWNLDACEFVIDFNRDAGANKRAIIFGDETLASGYYSNFDTKGRWSVRSGPNSTNNPVAVCLAFCAQNTVRGMNTASGYNNTLVEFLNPQNTELTDYKLYFGGFSFGYRDFAGSGFRRTNSTTITRTSGTAEFRASDVGKKVSIQTGGSNFLMTIMSVQNATTATVDISGTDTIDRQLDFGSPSPATTAGSPTFALDGDMVLDNSLIGLKVGVQRAGPNGGMWWGTIIDVSGRNITLDTNASLTLNPVANPLTESVDLAVPQVYLDSAVPPATNGISQVRFINGQHETFRGVAIGVQDAEHVHFDMVKAHATQSSQTWLNHSVGAVFANTLGGSWWGELDARYRGRARLFIAENTQGFHFGYLSLRMQAGEKLLECGPMRPGFAGASVTFGSIHVIGLGATTTFADIVTDRSTGGLTAYQPPIEFTKTDRNDDYWYMGRPNAFRGNGGFSLGNGAAVFDPALARLSLHPRTLVQGQAASLEIWDADNSGFTYLKFSNNGGAERGTVRHTTSSGQMDHQVAGATQLSIGAGLGFFGTAPVTRQTGVPVTAEAIHAALVRLGLITA